MPVLSGEDINKLMLEQSKNAIKIAVDELIQIYRDEWDDIIQGAIADQFTEKTQDKLRFLKTKEINLIKRVVNETSLVYKKPAIRECLVEGTGNTAEGEEAVVMTPDPVYAKMMEDTNLDIKMKQVNRYTNLCNHTMLKVVWRNGKIDYDILLFNNVEILLNPDDWMQIIAIKYYVGLELPEYYAEKGNESKTSVDMKKRTGKLNKFGMPIQSYNRAFLYTLEDVKIAKDDAGGSRDVVVKKGFIYTFEQIADEEVLVETEENPYRDEMGNVILPFVLFSKSVPVDKLLNFTEGNDLRDGNINIALSMVHLNNLLKFQSYKQIYMKVTDKTKVPQNMEFDPQTLVVIEDEEGKGELDVLDLQTSIDKVWEVIQKRIMTIIAQHGISPENFSLSGTPQSGFALKISNMAKLEAREDQIPIYREREGALNRKVKIVYNWHNNDKKIPYDSKFKIDFAEIDFPQSPEEKMTDFTFLKQNHIKTPIDLLMEHNPDLTRKQAEKKFEENKAANDELNVTLVPPVQPGEEKEEE